MATDAVRLAQSAPVLLPIVRASMTGPSQSRLARHYLLFSLATSVATLVGGILVLVGWQLDLDMLKRVLPGSSPMEPNTAIGFVLLGISLWLQQHWPNQSSRPSLQRKLVAHT